MKNLIYKIKSKYPNILYIETNFDIIFYAQIDQNYRIRTDFLGNILLTETSQYIWGQYRWVKIYNIHNTIFELLDENYQ